MKNIIKNIILFLTLSSLLSCAIETKRQIKVPFYVESNDHSIDGYLDFVNPDTTFSSISENSHSSYLLKMLFYSEGDTTFVESGDFIYIDDIEYQCADTATFVNYKCIIIY
jgi:hypothetical protein